ncbi:tumor necrosis factor ligand superfamily member 12 isoform X2 [Bombina bombina]|uniref:tumor necrosis factor ligand superfamily member 12 isoform X2 n=1 Tax=Bombina bombina TaxID=8345 RepID=UPI00235A5625|nr:tumor necrosis factor ligand superfamily member 12 isoform X2 [Bombina bombina]
MPRWHKKGTRKNVLFPLLLLALVLGGTALCLASVNLILTFKAWGRSLCQDRMLLPQTFHENVWEKQQFLFQKMRTERSLNKRSAQPKRGKSQRKPTPLSAAHFEVKLARGLLQMNADKNGTILHWVEVPLNSTSPVHYDDRRGEFIVLNKGLYYLYCQVHFNENRSIYIKLDLLFDNSLIFRCLQEFSATAASIHNPEVKTCGVSGLLLLRPGSSLRIRTIPDARLKTDRFLTYFGLFQVH